MKKGLNESKSQNKDDGFDCNNSLISGDGVGWVDLSNWWQSHRTLIFRRAAG